MPRKRRPQPSATRATIATLYNPKALRMWVDALRSGEYRQARRRLADGPTEDTRQYCALGVAAELFRRETGLGRWDAGERGGVQFVCDRRAYDIELPRLASEWLGVSPTAGPRIPLTDALREELARRAGDAAFRTTLLPFTTVSTLNDEGFSFDELAALIEETYL